MISLPHLLTTARRFVDGVCAIPRFASMERLEEMREASRKATQIRSELGIDETGLIRQLAAEREAHEETKNRLAGAEHAVAGALQTVGEQDRKLSAARAYLEALTRWVPGDKSPLMGKARVTVSDCDDYSDAIIVESADAYMYRFCRPIPESLAAWKAREGGTDGL